MKKPAVPKSVFVAPGARIVGDVTIGENASVFYNAVIRADVAPITIGEGTNIQDNCTLHCDEGVPLTVGDRVTVGHNAVLHCGEVGAGSLIGMGAVLLSRAKIGRGCIVAAGSVVSPGTVVEDGCLYMGVPARFCRRLSEEEREKLLTNAQAYITLSQELTQGI